MVTVNLHATFPQTLQKYHSQCEDARKPFSLQDKINLIDATFNASSVEAVIQNLKNNGSEWATKTVETLSKMSPTSMKITLKLLELGSEMDLQECLRIEYRLSQRCSEDHDFTEGSKCVDLKTKYSCLYFICEHRTMLSQKCILFRCPGFTGG